MIAEYISMQFSLKPLVSDICILRICKNHSHAIIIFLLILNQKDGYILQSLFADTPPPPFSKKKKNGW